FRTGACGAHTSRTIMLAELRDLLDACPAGATRDEYRQAILAENVLRKKTLSTRRGTAQRLRELYALDPEVPLFRLLRFFWDRDPGGRPPAPPLGPPAARPPAAAPRGACPAGPPGRRGDGRRPGRRPGPGRAPPPQACRAPGRRRPLRLLLDPGRAAVGA